MRLLLLAIALTACAAVEGCNKPPAEPITQETPVASRPPTLENHNKIEVGMTIEEVEDILGPPGWTTQQEIKLPNGLKKTEVKSASWGTTKVFILVVGGGPAD